MKRGARSTSARSDWFAPEGERSLALPGESRGALSPHPETCRVGCGPYAGSATSLILPIVDRP
jgi:hypothetical protein